MNKANHSLAGKVVMMAIIAALLAVSAAAKLTQSKDQTPARQPIIFKSPDGYMSADFPGHTGKLLLDPKNPAGMFVAYPKEGQEMSAFIEEVKKMVADMFLHEPTKVVVWSEKPLPAHKGVVSESGKLLAAANDKMEVQLAVYVRSDKGVAYGYFAKKNKKGGGENAKFLNDSGGGVKAFDKLANSIGSEPKNQ